jgi:ribosomal protein S18 acetylase RimI-like enzyme
MKCGYHLKEREMKLDLAKVNTSQEWEDYHRIRYTELWIARGRTHPTYNANHPDEHKPEHTPLLLKLNGIGIGTTRLDDLGNGRFCVRLVAIDKAHQRQGLGRIMMEKTLELVQRKQGIEIVVNAYQTAVDFYRNHGFTEEMWDDSGVVSPLDTDCVQMIRRL